MDSERFLNQLQFLVEEGVQKYGKDGIPSYYPEELARLADRKLEDMAERFYEWFNKSPKP